MARFSSDLRETAFSTGYFIAAAACAAVIIAFTCSLFNFTATIDTTVEVADIQAQNAATLVQLSQLNRGTLETAAFGSGGFAVTSSQGTWVYSSANALPQALALPGQVVAYAPGRVITLADGVISVNGGAGEPLYTLPVENFIAAALSPNGERLAIAGSAVQIVDAADGSAVVTLDAQALALSFTPDNGQLITGHADGTVRLWDAATGEQVTTLEGEAGAIQAVAASADGQWIAAAAQENTLIVWNSAAGTADYLFAELSAPPSALVMHPANGTLAAGTTDGAIYLWDYQSGALPIVLSGHRGALDALYFEDGGTSLASVSSADGTVRWWDTTGGVPRAYLNQHQGPVTSIVFSPDGALVATTSGDHTVRLWSGNDGTPVRVLEGHTDVVQDAAFSPDGARLVTGSRDGTAIVWDVTAGEALLTLSGHSGPINGVAFSPDGTRIATASSDYTAKVWNAATGDEVYTFAESELDVQGCAFSPDGAQLAVVGLDKRVYLLDAATGDEIATLRGRRGELWDVAFSPDGALLATANGNFNVETNDIVQVWDLATGEEAAALSGHTGAVRSIAFSPDGRTILSGSWDGSARLWDVETWAANAVLSGHTSWVLGAAFNPDGSVLATASNDGTARLWEVSSGTQTAALGGFLTSAQAAAFAPEMNTLALLSDDTLRLWNINSGLDAQLFSLGDAPPTSLAYHPGGLLIATGGADGSVRLWNTSSGSPVLELSASSGSVNAVAFSADGGVIVAGSSDGALRGWSIAGEARFALQTAAPVTALASAPNGLLVGRGDGAVYLIDPLTGETRTELRTTGAAVTSLVLSAGRAVMGAEDGTITLWQLDPQTEITWSEGHSDAVTSLDLSADDTLLLSGGTDGAARVWSGADGSSLSTLIAEGAPLTDALFSPNQRRVVTVTEDGGVLIWGLP